jgi:hypothetical protein
MNEKIQEALEEPGRTDGKISVDEISEYLMMQLVVSYNLYRAVSQLHENQKATMPDNLVKKMDDVVGKLQNEPKGKSGGGFFEIMNFILIVALWVYFLFLK